MTNADHDEIGFRHPETGKVRMLNKKEKILIKALLGITVSSERIRKVIREKFGEEYVEVALRLHRAVSGGRM